MSFGDFRGEAKRLDDIDLPRIGDIIGVGEDEIHAVIDVESAGSGFDRLGRPKMLFEPHIFYRQLSGAERTKAVRKGLAYPKWRRNYPKDSYPRLNEAMKINETAALRSASWGMGQIMGFNHEAAGYDSVEDMVRAFMDDEDTHLEAMINFIIDKNLDDELRNHNWRGFARGYNGSGYAKNGYHTKLERAYRRWTKIKDTPWTPGQEEPAPVPKPIPTPRSPQEAPSDRTLAGSARIYLFRGMGGFIFSRGLDDLADKLERLGFKCSVHRYTEAAGIREQIEREYHEGRHGNFALIGHSLGANAALRLANNLSGEGVPIAYVASLDPTFRFTVTGIRADNFRSRDFRDRPVEGATEIPRDDLSHIELDNDASVHARIADMCHACLTGETNEREYKMENRKQPGSGLDTESEELIGLLLAILAARKGGYSGNRGEIIDYMRVLLGKHSDAADPLPNVETTSDAAAIAKAEPLTTVNAALGENIGRMLNGRKSAIGIVGLLATFLIPALAPNATMLVDILKAIGLDGAAVSAPDASPAKNIFGPIFGAMLTWGGLGKLEKWFKLIAMKK